MKNVFFLIVSVLLASLSLAQVHKDNLLSKRDKDKMIANASIAVREMYELENCIMRGVCTGSDADEAITLFSKRHLANEGAKTIKENSFAEVNHIVEYMRQLKGSVMPDNEVYIPSQYFDPSQIHKCGQSYFLNFQYVEKWKEKPNERHPHSSDFEGNDSLILEAQIVFDTFNNELTARILNIIWRQHNGVGAPECGFKIDISDQAIDRFSEVKPDSYYEICFRKGRYAAKMGNIADAVIFLEQARRFEGTKHEADSILVKFLQDIRRPGQDLNRKIFAALCTAGEDRVENFNYEEARMCFWYSLRYIDKVDIVRTRYIFADGMVKKLSAVKKNIFVDPRQCKVDYVKLMTQKANENNPLCILGIARCDSALNDFHAGQMYDSAYIADSNNLEIARCAANYYYWAQYPEYRKALKYLRRCTKIEEDIAISAMGEFEEKIDSADVAQLAIKMQICEAMIAFLEAQASNIYGKYNDAVEKFAKVSAFDTLTGNVCNYGALCVEMMRRELADPTEWPADTALRWLNNCMLSRNPSKEDSIRKNYLTFLIEEDGDLGPEIVSRWKRGADRPQKLALQQVMMNGAVFQMAKSNDSIAPNSLGKYRRLVEAKKHYDIIRKNNMSLDSNTSINALNATWRFAECNIALGRLLLSDNDLRKEDPKQTAAGLFSEAKNALGILYNLYFTNLRGYRYKDSIYDRGKPRNSSSGYLILGKNKEIGRLNSFDSGAHLYSLLCKDLAMAYYELGDYYGGKRYFRVADIDDPEVDFAYGVCLLSADLHDNNYWNGQAGTRAQQDETDDKSGSPLSERDEIDISNPNSMAALKKNSDIEKGYKLIESAFQKRVDYKLTTEQPVKFLKFDKRYKKLRKRYGYPPLKVDNI